MKIYQSIYFRTALISLLLFLTVGLFLGILTGQVYQNLIREADQKVQMTIAAGLEKELSPFIADSLDRSGIEDAMHYLMVTNPRVEIYLLDENGRPLAFFADSSKIKRESVRIEPIRRFMSGAPAPILGDDPRNPDGQKPFSVAGTRLPNGRPGFIYVILGGEAYDSAWQMVRGSHLARLALVGLGAVILVAWSLAILLFFAFTRRLRRVTETVAMFESGDFSKRVTPTGSDEFGALATAFNRMADSIVQSITEAKEADQHRRELVANISHDLRSPLASIQGYVETILLRDERISQEDRIRFLETILVSCKDLQRLVEQLFELSRLDTEDIRPIVEPFSVAELLQDVVMKLHPQAEKSNVNLKTELTSDTPLAYADIGMIERVLTNVVENAIRYSGAGSSVNVATTSRRNSVLVRVMDNGPGIPADDLPHIKNRFYRVEKSRARSSGGAGLGLAIADRMLVLNGSTLSVESVEGKGTTVSFPLPTNRFDLEPSAKREAEEVRGPTTSDGGPATQSLAASDGSTGSADGQRTRSE